MEDTNYIINDGDEGNTEKTPTDVFIKKPSRSVIIEPAAFLYILSIACTLPLSQQYLYTRIGNYSVEELNNATSAKSNCNPNATLLEQSHQNYVQEEVAQWSLYLNLFSGIPGVFSALVIGASSDIYGRKFPFYIGVVGFAIRIIVYILVINYELSLHFLIIGYLSDGVMGSFAAVMSTCFAYLADQFDGKKRTIRILILDCVFGLSFALSNIAMGYLLESFGFVVCNTISLIITFLALIYFFFFVPETVYSNTPKTFRSIPFRKFLNSLLIYIKDDGSNRVWKLRVYLMVFGFTAMSSIGGMEVRTLFQLDRPLCFSTILIGYYNAMTPTTWVIGGGVGMLVFYKVFKLKDNQIVVIATLSSCLSLVYNSFVTTTVMMFTVPLIGVFGVICLPVVRAIMSKTVESSDQGAFFSTVGAIEAACMTFASTLFTGVYSVTLSGTFHGFIFLFEASFALVATILALLGAIIWREKSLSTQVSNETLEEN